MTRIVLILAFATLVLSGVRGGSNQRTTQGEDEDKHLIKRIQEGDTSAIEAAGKSGNRLFVPHLRVELKDQKNGGTPSQFARIALAKLGEMDQQQQVWCRAITDDPKKGLDNTVFELANVGGWFGIQGLEKLLTPAGLVHGHKLSRKEKYSDASTDPIEVNALMLLPTIVPNPPVRYSTPSEHLQAQAHTLDEIKMWQDWIAAHKGELSKLQPTGEGVDFSPTACKDGKPRKTR